MFVVVDGRVDLTKEINGVERSSARGPGEIYGEVPVMLSMNMPASCVAVEASRMVKVDVGTFFTLAATAPQVVARVGALAQGRIEGLKEIAAEKPTPEMVVIGPPVDPRVHELRTFLHRNRISFDTLDTGREVRPARARDPVVGSPTAHGSSTRPCGRSRSRAGCRWCRTRDEYDVVIVGGGPTGLTAAVNGAAEGLRTLVVEKFAPGGQAGTSTRIENYTGFPFGVSGDELASKALRQAGRLGAEIVVTRTVEGVDPRTLVRDAGRGRAGRRQSRAADLRGRVAAPPPGGDRPLRRQRRLLRRCAQRLRPRARQRRLHHRRRQLRGTGGPVLLASPGA